MSEKVVVPQFVANWFERNKKGHTIYGLLHLFSDNYYLFDDFRKWVEDYDLSEAEAQDIIAKMYLFQDYKVEEGRKYHWQKKKEHRLDVEDPNSVYLNYYTTGNTIYFGNITDGAIVRTKLTEKEVASLVGEEDFKKLEKVKITEE